MTVIGADSDDGIVAEVGIISNAVEEARKLFIHGVEDAVIEGSFVSSPFVKGRPPRAVNVVGPEVDEEGFLFGLSLVDELEGFVDETGGNFGALHPNEALAEAFGIGPYTTCDGRSQGGGFQSKWEELGANAFEIGQTLMESVI